MNKGFIKKFPIQKNTSSNDSLLPPNENFLKKLANDKKVVQKIMKDKIQAISPHKSYNYYNNSYLTLDAKENDQIYQVREELFGMIADLSEKVRIIDETLNDLIQGLHDRNEARR